MADLLRARPTGPRRLRQALAAQRPLLAPGAYDALSARLVELAGFDVVYMTGFGTAASLLGRPDVGLLTQTEMVDNARRIAAAVDVPVVADADTGYGNPINVVRTVQEYERAGLAGLHLEDQVMPKRCGHMTGKQVVPMEDMVAKVAAAVEARQDPDFLLIARTDARAPEGVAAALERAHAYREAGADMLFVEALEGEDEIELVARELADVPLLFNWAEGGRTPPLPFERLEALGYALVIFPIGTMLAATQAMQAFLDVVRKAGTPLPVLGELPRFDQFTDLIGLPEIRRLEERFGSAKRSS
ncbi:MAG: 2,3-dimethylmalate lyase [Acidimicrobiia bacterium]|nr:2,3-dimethylmalate lyase [Acidimicrobiia bacterium]